MTNERTSVASLPTLDELRVRIGVSPSNVVTRYAWRGIEWDDADGLHALADERGGLRVSAGPEMPCRFFRGQPQEHAPCLSKLGRLNTKDAPSVAHMLKELCRSVAFEHVMSDHPLVRLLESEKIAGHSFFVDKLALAQHYELTTDMLDLTTNFDVASFFATCAWDGRGYQPVPASAKAGVMYLVIAPLLALDLAPHAALERLRIVGWQPLPRPERQRAWGLRLKLGDDFASMPSVQCFRFQHCNRISERIWNLFEGGRLLFPPEGAAFLADRAKTLSQFTRRQIDEAWDRLQDWLGRRFDEGARALTENSAEIVETHIPVLSWVGLDVERDESKLRVQVQSVMEKVGWRLARTTK